MYSENLNPNKLATDFLLAIYLAVERKKFMFVERVDGVKVYRHGIMLWCSPAIGQAPPKMPGRNWEKVIKVKRRTLFRSY